MTTSDPPTDTTEQSPLDRVWSVAAIPLMVVGLGMWVAGISLNAYWVIVGGTLFMALGAYRYTDR